MHSYNVITNQESYPREIYYSQAKRIEELENYIMDENFNPYQDSWTDVKKMEELGISTQYYLDKGIKVEENKIYN